MSKNFVTVKRASKQYDTAYGGILVWDICLTTGADVSNNDITIAIKEALDYSNFSAIDERFWLQYIKDNLKTIKKWIEEKPDERIEQLFHAPFHDILEEQIKQNDPELHLIIQVKKEGGKS